MVTNFHARGQTYQDIISSALAREIIVLSYFVELNQQKNGDLLRSIWKKPPKTPQFSSPFMVVY